MLCKKLFTQMYHSIYLGKFALIFEICPIFFRKRNMGGVDLSDALIGYYTVLRKTRKWYHSLFYHFVDIAIVNAFILHQQMAASQNQKAKSQKEFREALVLELADWIPRNEPGPSAPPAPAPQITGRHPGHACHRPHYIASQFIPECRKRCSVCQQKTAVICRACNLYFCFQAGRDCFNHWHDAQNL